MKIIRCAVKKLPFSINRNDTRPYVNQVVDGLKDAIVSGYYLPGDKIPTSRELCPILGVSRIVTQAALEQLVAEGFVVSRPRVGTVVCDRGVKQWKGHVILVYEKDDNNYLNSMIAGIVLNRLTEIGYLFTQVSVGANGNGLCDFSHLDAALSRSIDLVVVMYHRPEIYAYLAKHKVPYAVVSEVAKKPSTAVGSIHFDYNLAASDFANACKAAGITEVVEVYWHKLMCDVAPALKSVGIKVKKVKAPVDESQGRLIGVKRSGRIVFEKLLSDRKLNPASGMRLFFIADDYLAEGALLALSCAGLKAPSDIRLVTWANRGLGPDYIYPLSRMEVDPFAVGGKVADAIAQYLKARVFPATLTVGPAWIEGKTFCVK